MRWFRVPAFSGIQAAADDADRGTLRIVEGCLPVGTGGLHSGPVWSELGTVDRLSSDANNSLTGADDASGNSILMASRQGVVHDLRVFPVANTELGTTKPCYDVSVGSLYNKNHAYISAVGNRMVAFGDGTSNALFAGRGDISEQVGSSVAVRTRTPDSVIYDLEYSEFPKCRFFVVGPHKTLFAAGDPDQPLTIYVSEPAGLTQSDRDSLYSLKATSSVDLLMTDATKVTALSCVSGNVAAHTDAGIFLLSPPTPDQASTGYRVEQAPTSVASAAVNLQVVAGEDGTQPYYLGFDGQIWGEPQGPGSEQKISNAEVAQPSALAKGRWDSEHPKDLSNSFAAYDPEVGQYWVYLENEDNAAWLGRNPPSAPASFVAEQAPTAPAYFNASADLTSIPPSAPTNYTGSVDLASIPPSTPLGYTAYSPPVVPSAPSAFVATHTIVKPSAPTTLVASLDLSSVPPSAPTNFAGPSFALPNAPSNFHALYALTEPSAPTTFSAGYIPIAPSAPSTFDAALDLSTIVPSAPSTFGAALDLSTIVPSTPTTFDASYTLVEPSAPSALAGAVDLDTIPPSAPADLSGADDCDPADYCQSRWFVGGVPNRVLVTATATGGGLSFQGRLSRTYDNTNQKDGHHGYHGYLLPVGYNINKKGSPCILEAPAKTEPGKTKLAFFLGYSRVDMFPILTSLGYYAPSHRHYITSWKDWSQDGPCSSTRCLPYGTYTGVPGSANARYTVTVDYV